MGDVTSCREVADCHAAVEPTFATELRPGFVLDGRFVLDEPVSRSGMVTIYKARDTPVIAGTFLALGFIAVQLLLFFCIRIANSV